MTCWRSSLRVLSKHKINLLVTVSGWKHDGPALALQETRLREGICEILCREVDIPEVHRSSSIFCPPSPTPYTSLKLKTGPVSFSTGSFEVFNLLHSWIRTCESHHVDCVQRRREGRDRLPTRLLYIG